MSTAPASAKTMHLGDYLVARETITEEQRKEALRRHKQSGRRLGEVLVDMGVITEEDVSRYLAERADIPFTRLVPGLADPAVTQLLPRDKAELYEVLPLFRIHNRLFVAISDPHKVFTLDVVRKASGCDVEPVLSLKQDIVRMIEQTYSLDEGSIRDFVPGLDESELQLVTDEEDRSAEDIAEMAGGSPTINLVNLIIYKAIKERASDIHIEPERTFFRVRYRIDGVLYEVMKHRIELHPALVSRLKIMANLDIAERRLPQDGRMQVLAHGRTVDLRFSSLPGAGGEKIVLRVLDRESGSMDLEQLGFADGTLADFRALLQKPHGLLLVTGPTGSGKTTTLYAGLKQLNSMEKNIVTIEDPVEYQFDIINQNQVREEIGLSFARILKHTLRQDPDIIMVGEIRGADTASIAVQAALTGHLVLSTLHTNDAASAVTRLLEMDIEPYLLASSLVGVLAQRLVRTICPDCRTAYYASSSELRSLGLPPDASQQLHRGKGCAACFDSGYRGRIGIYELLTIDSHLQGLLLGNPTLDEIRDYQSKHDHATLRAEGIGKVLTGQTTLEEVTRAVIVE